MRFEIENNSKEIGSLKGILNKSEEDNKNLIESITSLQSTLIKIKENFILDITDLKIKLSILEKQNKSFSSYNKDLESSYNDLKVKNLKI